MTFIKANDSAMGNSNFERNELDFYPTPEWITEAIIPILFKHHINKEYVIWEPACGMKHMSNVLEKYSDVVVSSDIHNYNNDDPDVKIVDFLKFTHRFDSRTCIITNPPYGNIAEDFIKHALEILPQNNGVCAFLMRNEYDCAKTRAYLFNKHPFSRKVILTTRPKWIENSTGSPRHNYAWYIWDYKHPDNFHPVIEYHIK
jgi:hypothetical protein